MKSRSKIFITFLMFFLVLGFPSLAKAKTSEEIQFLIDSKVVPTFYNQSNKPAFADNNGSTESIDEQTGTLRRKEIDVTLPGRDGLDLVIGRNFSSSMATPFVKSVQGRTTITTQVSNPWKYTAWDPEEQKTVIFYTRGGSGDQGYLDLYMLYTYGYGNYTKTRIQGTITVPTYEFTDELRPVNVTEQFNLGAGWTWSFPYIERIWSQSLQKRQLYYHDSGGAAYEIHMLNDDEGTLLNYPYTIQTGKPFKKCTDPNGITTFQVTDPKQTITYFDASGKLTRMQDRFGNQINFQYNADGYLDTITDTVGRTVQFNYSTNRIDMVISTGTDSVTYSYVKGTMNCTGLQNVLNAPSASRVSVQKTQTILNKVIDPANNETIYAYDQMPTEYTYDTYVSNRKGQDVAIRLTSVEYPHSKDSYSYELLKRFLNNNGYAQTYRVTKRKTNEFDQNRNLKQDKNVVNYSYESNSQPDDNDDYIALDMNFRVLEKDGTDHAAMYRYHSTKTIMDGNTAVLSEKNTFEGRWQRKLKSEIEALSGPNDGEKKVTEYRYYGDFGEPEPLDGREIYYNEPAKVNKPLEVSTTHYSASGEAGETLTTSYVYDPVYNAVQTETLPVTAAQANNDKYKITYSYNPNFMELASKTWYQKETDSSPVTESYIWDQTSTRLDQTTDTLGQITNYDYEYNEGKVSKVTVTKNIEDGKQSKAETTYTAATGYAYPEQMTTYADGQPLTSSTSYNMLLGLPGSTTDAKGRVTTYEYDDIGRVTKVIMPNVLADGKTCAIEQNTAYTPKFILTSAHTKNSDTENQNLNVFKVESSTKYTVNGGAPATYNKEIGYYNYAGNLLVTQSYGTTNALANCRETQYHYDKLGRPIYAIDPAGNTMSGSYDSWGDLNKVIDPQGNSYCTDNNRKERKITTYFKANGSSAQEHIMEKTLDQWGRTTQAKAMPSGLTESFTYDLTGNVLTHTDPKGNTTNYNYDNAGQLLGVTDRLNQTTSYDYTILGKLKTITNTDGSKSWTTTKTYDELGRLKDHKDPGSLTDTYHYNNAGLVDVSTDPNGTQFSSVYDNQDRILTSTGTKAELTSNYAYIYGANPYGIKSIQKDTDPAINYDYYNNFGQVQNISLNGHQINYKYDDPAGRVSAVGIDSGNWSLIKYNKDRLEKIQTDGSLTANAAASVNAVYNYNPDGSLESVTYPNNGSNVIKSSYAYNELGRLTSVTNQKDSTPLSQYTYHYDNNGNIDSVTDANGTVNYDYDKIDRLEKVKKDGTVVQQFTYDVRGNRETQLVDAPMTEDEISYNYNLWNQLTSIQSGTNTTSFEYGPTGLRVKKGNKNYIYNANGNIVAEADANNAITATYIWGGDRLLVKKLANGTQYYFLYNGHGDVVQIVDTAGTVVNSYQYDEWGNIISQTEGIENEFKYAGQIYDSETGLYYLRARYYDPTIGRFISKDSNEGNITNPLSLNLYTYCENEPLGNVDLSGQAPTNPYDLIDYNKVSTSLVVDFYNLSVEKVTGVYNDVNDFVWRDDWNTLNNPNASKLEKGLAIASLNPFSKAEGVGGKILTKVVKYTAPWIKKETFSFITNKYGKSAANDFVEAMKKGFVGPKGEEGIKKLSADKKWNGITYTHEIKVMDGQMRNYRVYGYYDQEKGQFIFDKFGDALHK